MAGTAPTGLGLQAIAELVTGWMRRDLAQWEALREFFHADGTIEVTWFEGLFTDFVDASMRMGSSDLRTKHAITAPVVTFHGNRSIAETNAIIVAENVGLGVGAMAHNRFYDRIEKRDGTWKIVNRQAIYDMGSLTFPAGPVGVDGELIRVSMLRWLTCWRKVAFRSNVYSRPKAAISRRR